MSPPIKKLLDIYGLYPIVDFYTPKNPFLRQKDFKAKWTGEYRPPKKGEWYLSGAIPGAYRAPNDLGMYFHIAKLVQVRHVSYYEEVRDAS